MSKKTKTPKPKNILSLCDYSGVWSKPYRDAGYNVIQVDLQHGQDVRLLQVPTVPIHGIIAQPPCTDFAASGAWKWEEKGKDPLLDSLSIVDACLAFVTLCNPAWWVMENPVGRLMRFRGKPKFTFQPHEYAGWLDDNSEAYTKRTCLWGNFKIPEKKNIEPQKGSIMLNFPPSEDRGLLRSVTPTGFAKAFFAANP